MFDVRSLIAAFRRRPGPQNAFERGVAALDEGNHEHALFEFGAALAEATDAGTGAGAGARAVLQNKRGVALVALARRDEALEAFTLALECDGTCAPALANIGNLLFEDGHVLDAVDYYEAALRADERYAVAHRNLGVAYKRLGRPAEAVRALRAAARLEGRRPLARA